VRIVHICLCGPVTDSWSYQDNILTKYHAKLGHEVTMIASEWMYDDNGKIIQCDKTEYINENNVRMIRLKSKYMTKIDSKFKLYNQLPTALEREKADIIFVHGCQFLDIREIVKYAKKHPKVRIYLDNHADLSNSASNWLSKNILHRILWKHCAQMIEPYTTKFYGVLPARVDFLIDMYKLPKNKVELLVMGADDELVTAVHQEGVREAIREELGIVKDDFLIITGGKIDHNKTQTLLLMEAIKQINREDVKLIVFGSVTQDLKAALEKLCDGNLVRYIGWIQAEQSYKYFAAADLVVFPGLHSVFWEQVVGLGKPCLFRYMEGFTHVDLGGNCEFLYEDSAEEIQIKITAIVEDQNKYEEMKRIALTEGMKTFSYREIARKSVEA